ncbi:MAG: pyridoxamine 5'-phosphate oxidase family protein [Paludibacter sp.]|nr:pyridoxamine 5'-phosphate oxidase family protein [Paludibacter sp.]
MMRRKDRAITEDEAIEILIKGEHGILSMCTPENEGYGIPLNYVLDNHQIYFHCAATGSKLDYLRTNNKVSFCVVGNTTIIPSDFGTLYESTIVSGITSEVDGNEKRDALIKIIEKYSVDFIKEGNEYIDKLYDRVCVIKLSIQSITGKAKRQ